jgi:hypothetical protein
MQYSTISYCNTSSKETPAAIRWKWPECKRLGSARTIYIIYIRCIYDTVTPQVVIIQKVYQIISDTIRCTQHPCLQHIQNAWCALQPIWKVQILRIRGRQLNSWEAIHTPCGFKSVFPIFQHYSNSGKDFTKYTMYIYGSGQPYKRRTSRELANPTRDKYKQRIGQSYKRQVQAENWPVLQKTSTSKELASPTKDKYKQRIGQGEW